MEQLLGSELFAAFPSILERDDYFVAKEAFFLMENVLSVATHRQIQTLLRTDAFKSVLVFMMKWVISKQMFLSALDVMDKMLDIDQSGICVQQCIHCGALQFLLEFVANKAMPAHIVERAAGITSKYF